MLSYKIILKSKCSLLSAVVDFIFTGDLWIFVVLPNHNDLLISGDLYSSYINAIRFGNGSISIEFITYHFWDVC